MDLSSQVPTDASGRLLGDLCQKLETDDILAWIEKTAEQLSAYGDNGSFLELTPTLLEALGVARLEYSPNSLGTASLRLSKNNSPVIQHHLYQGRENQRFWIAHELGHLLWRDNRNQERRISQFEPPIGEDPTIEWLCNRFAAALLLPRGMLQRSLRRFGMLKHGRIDYTNLKCIPLLARYHRVPEQLVARRLWHELGGLRMALFSLTACSSPCGEVTNYSIAWDAIPRFTIARERRLYGRKVPASMLPKALPYAGRFDGRWVVLSVDALTGRRGRPLYRMSSDFVCEGYADNARVSSEDAKPVLVAIDIHHINEDTVWHDGR